MVHVLTTIDEKIAGAAAYIKVGIGPLLLPYKINQSNYQVQSRLDRFLKEYYGF
jgi:hypothetical protein